MVNGPTVSPAPELSRGVRGVMGKVREEVEKPNMKPA